MRQMIQKGDPMLRVQISQTLYDALLKSAKCNKRRPQDHFIKCLAHTLADTLIFDRIQAAHLLRLQEEKSLDQFKKFAQIIPSEMLNALNQAATAKGISLELEVASRLHAALAALEAVCLNFNSQQIRTRKFNLKEAVAECARKRRGNLYLYELEKLRLYLRFKDKLPRGLKEKFSVIDVVAASKEILAELAAEIALFEHNID